jgi:hypothetical protein
LITAAGWVTHPSDDSGPERPNWRKIDRALQSALNSTLPKLAPRRSLFTPEYVSRAIFFSENTHFAFVIAIEMSEVLLDAIMLF